MSHSRLDSVKDWDRRMRLTEFRVEKLAANCGVTERQLERFVHRNFHQAPREWVMDERLRIARCMLEAGFSVKEAAAAVLYSRASHFSRAFKKRYGRNPSASRRQRLRR